MSCLAVSAAGRVAGFDLAQLLLLIPTLLIGAWFLLSWWRENDDAGEDGDDRRG